MFNVSDLLRTRILMISILGTIFNPSLVAHQRISFREYILNDLSLILMFSRLGILEQPGPRFLKRLRE